MVTTIFSSQRKAEDRAERLKATIKETSKLIKAEKDPYAKEYLSNIKDAQKSREKEEKEKAKWIEKKREKFSKYVSKLAKTKLKHRPVLKKSKATVNIPDYKAPSVLGDPNRFFKAEFDETKRSAYTEW